MPLEDFTPYIKVDVNSRLTVAPNVLTITNAQRGETAHIYDAHPFSGDFEHKVAIIRHSGGDSFGSFFAWSLWDNNISPDTGLNVALFDEQAYPNGWKLLLQEKDFRLPNGETEVESGELAFDTNYYLTIKRVGSTLTCDIYDDNGFVETLSVPLIYANGTLNYIILGVARPSTNYPTARASGTIANLDLQEVPPPLQEYVTPWSDEADPLPPGNYRIIFPETIVLGDVQYTFSEWQDLPIEDPEKTNPIRTITLTGTEPLSIFAGYAPPPIPLWKILFGLVGVTTASIIVVAKVKTEKPYNIH